MTEQDDVREMAREMLAGDGCATPWTRRFLSQGGASGVVTETQPPVVFTVIALAVDAGALRMLQAEWWVQAEVRLAVAASGLPFDPGPSGDPEILFEDLVQWGDKTYRVTGVETFWTPGSGTQATRPFLYFVGLGA